MPVGTVSFVDVSCWLAWCHRVMLVGIVLMCFVVSLGGTDWHCVTVSYSLKLCHCVIVSCWLTLRHCVVPVDIVPLCHAGHHCVIGVVLIELFC